MTVPADVRTEFNAEGSRGRGRRSPGKDTQRTHKNRPNIFHMTLPCRPCGTGHN